MSPDDVSVYAFINKYHHSRLREVRSFGDFTVPDITDPDTDNSGSEDESDMQSLFDRHLLSGWDHCVRQQMFKYTIDECESRVLVGKMGFVAQLNEGRATKKRQTEFRMDRVAQDFNPGKFNFNKAGVNEVLFRFEPISSKSQLGRVAESEGAQFVPDNADPPRINDSPNLVIINVSPIEYGHVLLVPRVRDNLPQQVTAETLRVTLEMAQESDNPYFRIGFNSLGAYGSVNHLHFQGYYMDAPFPVERAPTIDIQMVNDVGNVRIQQLAYYPVRAFVLEISNSDGTLDELATVCAQACAKMTDANIPHNLFVVDRGSRIFIFPQCFEERKMSGEVPEWILETGVNPAAFETAGHLLMKARDDYELLTEDKACELLAHISLSESRFLDVAHMCFRR